ncbi:MAG: M48 family metalloprotease [Deltaproteobacteria bacterium]|nr:M48 family metalloprotease [Deltaproteobacteria bacterium]
MFLRPFIKQISLFSFFIFFFSILLPGLAEGISAKKEQELSEEFLKAVFKRFEIIDDPLIVKYINNIGNRIVATLPPQPFKYHFYVIKEDAYNAFAGPAGHIFIFSGLIEAMDNEEELAGIIGHEISHVVCRHISKRIERSKKISALSLAGIAAGILLGIAGAGEAAQAVMVGSQAAGHSAALAYSREDEMQADEIGLKYLKKAGYNGKELITILQKIKKVQWFGPKQIPTYLTTHPAIDDRIIYIGSWLEVHGKKGKKPIRRSSSDFERAQARLFIKYGDKNKVLQRFKAKVTNHPGDPMAHYQYGLILERVGHRKDAINHLKIALEKNIFDSAILYDLGRIYFLDGRFEEALRSLKSAESISSYDPEGRFFLGRTLLALGRLNESLSVFNDLIENNSEYTEAFYFIGKIYGKQGNLGDAHLHLGTYYKERGDLKNGIFHLKKALKYVKDPVKKKKIEKMIEDGRKRNFAEEKPEKANKPIRPNRSRTRNFTRNPVR